MISSNLSSSQRYRITFVLVAVNIAVYAYTSWAGGNVITTSDSMVWQWGQVNLLVLSYGAYYQLFTSMFIHASIIHLAGNMLFLFIFGLRGEEMFSLPEYLAVYILGGLAGNLLSLVVGPNMISVGASGAIFALFGAVAVYSRRSIGQSILGALIFGFFLLIISSGSDVNYFAHIGGLVSGITMGYVLAKFRKPSVSYQVTYNYMTPF